MNRISVMTSSGVVKWTCFSVNNWGRRQIAQKWVLIKNCVKNDSKKKKKKKKKTRRILLSQFYYKVDKDKGSVFFHCYFAFCIFVVLGKKNGYLISCCGNIKKRIMCEARPRTRLNNLKTCLRFPCLGLNTIIDSVKLTVLLWCINNINMYVVKA